MSNEDNGGPAFARAADDGELWGSDGMSLRDYFAGQALAGLTANEKHMAGISQLSVEMIVSTLAAHAYEVADALLAERVVK